MVFVIDVAELGFNPRECLVARPFSAGSLRRPCTVQRKIVDDRQEVYRKIVARLKTASPRLQVFDALPLLCDENACYGFRDGHAYYDDDDHLGTYGSELVGSRLVDSLRVTSSSTR